MNSITKIALALCVLYGLVFAQEQQVVFYFVGKEPKAGVYKQLADHIIKAMVRSGKYKPIDYTKEVQKLLAKEHERTRIGLTAQMSEMGIQSKADYVLAIEVSPSIDAGSYYFRAQMVHADSSFVKDIGYATGKLSNLELESVAMDIIADLFDIGGLFGSTLIDSRDKQKYKVVKIGKQTWMAQNLNYAKPSSVCYANLNDLCKKYGRLYEWDAAMTACPEGWHLPSEDEWMLLIYYVGAKTAGKKLKAKNGWSIHDGKSGNGTDDYGFAALGTGYYNDGYIEGEGFRHIGSYTSFWSSSKPCKYGLWNSAKGYDEDWGGGDVCSKGGDPRPANFRLHAEEDAVFKFSNFNTFAYSVRCVKD